MYGSWGEDNLQQFQDCAFIVDSNLYSADSNIARGLTFSIRGIKFRSNSTTNQCIDYVRFTFGKDLSKTEKICGAFDGDDENGHQAYFLDPTGIIKVHIFVDKSIPLDITQRSLEIDIAFTAYERMLIDFFLILIIPLPFKL